MKNASNTFFRPENISILSNLDIRPRLQPAAGGAGVGGQGGGRGEGQSARSRIPAGINHIHALISKIALITRARDYVKCSVVLLLLFCLEKCFCLLYICGFIF